MIRNIALRIILAVAALIAVAKPTNAQRRMRVLSDEETGTLGFGAAESFSMSMSVAMAEGGGNWGNWYSSKSAKSGGWGGWSSDKSKSSKSGQQVEPIYIGDGFCQDADHQFYDFLGTEDITTVEGCTDYCYDLPGFSKNGLGFELFVIGTSFGSCDCFYENGTLPEYYKDEKFRMKYNIAEAEEGFGGTGPITGVFPFEDAMVCYSVINSGAGSSKSGKSSGKSGKGEDMAGFYNLLLKEDASMSMNGIAFNLMEDNSMSYKASLADTHVGESQFGRRKGLRPRGE